MKKKVFYLFVLLGGLLIGGARRVQAQVAESADGYIPFQFCVGGKELPAGKYSIRPVSPAKDSGAMEIQSADGKVAALFETERSDISAAMNNDELIFNLVGDNYFLSQIVDADDGTDTEVFNSGYRGKQDTAQHSTGRRHMFGFLSAL
jgi:hypothetical protein